MDAYKKATGPYFGYMLVDIYPTANPEYRLRSHILPGQDTIVYRDVYILSQLMTVKHCICFRFRNKMLPRHNNLNKQLALLLHLSL